MSMEEATSTQGSTPMDIAEVEDVEIPIVNGTNEDSNPDLNLRVQDLLNGVHGDNVEELLNTMISIVDSVNSVPVSANIAKAVHFLTAFLVRLDCPIRGIKIVDSLLSKYPETHASPSSIHSDFLQLCLAAKVLSPAIKYLDRNVTAISRDEVEDVRYVLQYYYYGGCIYAALSNFSRAKHFFEICLSVPSFQTTSAIQVVAYQKLTLVAILCSKTVSARALPEVHSNISHPCRPYSNLLQIAAEGDSERFAASIAQMTPLLEKQHNLGLAKQALEHIRQQNIHKFQSTFLSLKLSTLANHLKLPVTEVETRLRRMVMAGRISAKICKMDNVVWFTRDSDDFDDPSAIENLKTALDTCIESYQKTKKLDESLSLNQKLLTVISDSETRNDTQPTSSSWDFPAHGKSKKILSILE